MLRCIENAIQAGRLTREQGEALQGRVDAMLKEGLAPPDVRARMAKDFEIEAQERRRRGLLMELRRKVLTEYLLTHRNARGENDPAEAFVYLLEHHGQAQIKDIETTRLVILGRAHAELESLTYEFRKGIFTGDLRRRQSHQAARMESLVRELFGEDSGDQSAKVLAESWSRVTEGLRLRYNAAGGAIGKLQRDGLRWGLTQTHDEAALLGAKFNGKTGRPAWVDYLMQPGVLDRERMTTPEGHAYADDELREILGHIWERITSDGWIDRETSYVPYGKGALGKQRDLHHRFLHFKNADAWLAYQRAYGEGDPFATMMGHLARMARDIATMEVLGPNPEAMRNYLKQVVLKQAAIERPIGRSVENASARLVDLLDGVLEKERGRAWLGEVVGKVNELAELQRRLRALDVERPPAPQEADPRGARGMSPREALEAEVKERSAELEEMKRALTMMESRQSGDRRAALTAEQESIRRQIEGVTDKAAPQLSGLSRRNRRKLEDLQQRERAIATELQEMDFADTSVAVEHRDVYRQIVGTIDGLVEGRVRLDPFDGRISMDGYRSVDNPGQAAQSAIHRHDAMWDLIRGTHFTPVSSKWANAMQGTRNILTGALLGSASISALSDLGFQRHARAFVGLPKSTLATIGEYADAMRTSTRREAVRSGLILDSALHVMHNQARYAEFAVHGSGFVKWTGFVSDRIIAASGLSVWTQGGKHAFGMSIQAEIADRVNLRFAELPELVRRAFDRHGITGADWDKMRGASLYEPHEGATFLRPNEIAKVDEAVAEKYLGMILRETRFAVPEGTVRSRTWLQGGRPGTIVGELARNFGQFKSFGVAVVMLHGGRIADEFRRGNPTGGMAMLGGLAMAGAIGGAIVNELLEIINGREPIMGAKLRRGEVPGWEYWGAALLRAGGMGIYGDILFQGLSRPGGLSSILIGPLGGFADRVRTRSLGNVQEGMNGKDMHLGREGVATVRELMPGSTLWYLRLIKERWFLNQMQWALDEHADRSFKRHETMQRKSYGNEYWWRPGASVPRGTPWQPAPPLARGEVAPAREDRGPVHNIGEILRPADDKKFKIVDGDTIEAHGRRWRLHGFDTPEVYSQRAKVGDRVAGMRAALRLQEIVRGAKKVELEVTDKPDRWGRGRGRLTIDGRDIKDIMTEEGLVARRRR